MGRLLFLGRYIWLYKLSYFWGVVFIVVTNWIMVSIPVYLKLSIDFLSKGAVHIEQNQEQLWRYLLIMFILAAALMVIRILSRIFFFNPGRAIEFKVKNDLFKKLTSLPKGYYDKNPTGAIISRIQNDVNGVRMICGFGMLQLFNIVTALSFTPLKMWQISPDLTLRAVVPIVSALALTQWGIRFLLKSSRARMVSLQEMSAFVVSSFSGLDAIKDFDLRSWAEGEFEKRNRRLLELSIKISFIRSFVLPVLSNLENVLRTVILLTGGLYVISQDMSIGELTAFMSYAALLTMPIMALGWLSGIFQTGMLGVDSLRSIFDEKNPYAEIKALPPSSTAELFKRGLEVGNLTYSYPGADRPALENISFSVKPDQTVGVFGKIGSGKTTLANCLNRYLEIEDNRIFLGGVDINSLAYSDVRSVIKTVTQDAFLFSDTIERNILFGNKDEECGEARYLDKILYEAALKEEIERFPKGLQSLAGEKGIMLSGGQKQRVSIARAMASSFDLLILDNVLSAVDHETERFLLRHILKRERGKSMLIISSRVQALERADLILILENGRVTDRGTHSELIERSGIYRETWLLQKQAD